MPVDSASLLSRKLHFVSGKGGVGKSVVACALARALQQRGEDVLLVQVNALDAHAPLLEIAPATSSIVQAEPGLSIVNLEPGSCMKEYVLMTLRFETVYRAVFENRITQAFLRFVPSLSELTMLGKIWHHAAVEGRYSKIVVDCPATGHGLRFVGVARTIHEATRIGPMAEKTEQMATFIASEATAFHIVTLPEELPVTEAIELHQAVAARRLAPEGALFVNQKLTPLVTADVEAGVAQLAGTSSSDAQVELIARVEARQARELLEASELLRAQSLRRRTVVLPRRPHARLGRMDIEALAHAVVTGGA